MDKELLGKRLRSARIDMGVSQQDAADALRLPRTAITQLESGNRSVSTLELTKLAALYQRPVAHFLAEAEGADEEDLSVALLRVAPGLEDELAIRKEIARSLALFREGVSIERLLGQDERSGPPAYEVGPPKSIGEAISEGASVADQERRRLGIGVTPIADVSELLSAQGIWASGMKLPDQMSGVFLHHPSIGLGILVNASHPRARKRFSYAHEYAHALMDRNRNVAVTSVDNAADLVEKRANAFAAAFLMPPQGVADVLAALDKGQPSRSEQMIFDAATGGSIEAQYRPAARSQRITYADVALMAHHFGVSYQAAAYRLRSLRHVNASELDELLAQESVGRSYLEAIKMLDDLDEPTTPDHWDRELKGEILHLAIEAYRRGEISRGRLLDLKKPLGVDGPQLVRLAEAAREA